VQVQCPLCRTPVDLDDRAAGTLVRCRACGKSFVGPRELAVIGRRHTLTAFSVTGLLLLHYVTVGLFTVVHLNMMHDKLPKVRRTDPSALVAVGLCFVPGVNLLWLFFTLRRLCLRINEQRSIRGMEATAPQTFAIIVSTLLLCGFIATILPITGWVLLGATNGILIPVFIAMLQASVNELVAYREQWADTPVGQNRSHEQPRRAAGDRDRDLGPPGKRGPLARTGGR